MVCGCRGIGMIDGMDGWLGGGLGFVEWKLSLVDCGSWGGFFLAGVGGSFGMGLFGTVCSWGVTREK